MCKELPMPCRFTKHYYIILSLLLQFVKTHWCDWHMWQLLLVQHTPLSLEGMYTVSRGAKVGSSQVQEQHFCISRVTKQIVYLISATCLGLSTVKCEVTSKTSKVKLNQASRWWLRSFSQLNDLISLICPQCTCTV